MTSNTMIVYAKDAEGLAAQLREVAEAGFQPISITASSSGLVALASIPQIQSVNIKELYIFLWKLFAASFLFSLPFALIAFLIQLASK